MIIGNLQRKPRAMTSADDEVDLDFQRGKIKWELSDSFHLRLLIHYVGDIHQPLHTSSRFTKLYPNGDEGGNAYSIQEKDEDIDNLHALWDSVLYS